MTPLPLFNSGTSSIEYTNSFLLFPTIAIVSPSIFLHTFALLSPLEFNICFPDFVCATILEVLILNP